MDTDWAADARRHLRDRSLNGQCGARRALGIVVVRNGGTEDCHYAVADVPDDMSAMLLDDAVGAVEELLKQGMDLFGVELLTPGCVAGEIGEQHRHLPPLAGRVDR